MIRNQGIPKLVFLVAMATHELTHYIFQEWEKHSQKSNNNSQGQQLIVVAKTLAQPNRLLFRRFV